MKRTSGIITIVLLLLILVAVKVWGQEPKVAAMVFNTKVDSELAFVNAARRVVTIPMIGIIRHVEESGYLVITLTDSYAQGWEAVLDGMAQEKQELAKRKKKISELKEEISEYEKDANIIVNIVPAP